LDADDRGRVNGPGFTIGVLVHVDTLPVALP
jgi:hypothetical protein